MRYDKRESRAYSNVRQGESRHAYNPSSTNKIKLRQDFITMQQEYQSHQMTSA